MKTEAARSAWLAERKDYLGASEVAAALGLSPHEGPLDVWARKLGIVGPKAATVAMDLGTVAEPIILARYVKRTGAILAQPGTTTHLLDPWLRATPDAIADGKRNVQAKLVIHSRDAWGPEDAGADGVPEWYLVQVQIEMEVIGLRETDVAALVLGEEMPRIYRVERDPELAGALVEQARDWWVRYVEPRDPDIFPDASGSMDTLRARFPRVERPLLPAPAEFIDLAAQYATARAAEGAARAEKERIAPLLCARIGDAEGLEWPGGKATWRMRKGFTRPACVIEPARTLDVRIKETDQ